MAFVGDRGVPSGRADRLASVAGGAPGLRLEPTPESIRRGLTAFPEIDCVRHRLPPAVIALAEKRAHALDVGADEVLVASGTLSEDAYCRAFAFALGLPFVDIEHLPRSACPLDDNALLQAARASVLALEYGGQPTLIVAPRGVSARNLVALIRLGPESRRRVRVTTPTSLRRFVHAHCGGLMSERASHALRSERPDLSAAPRHHRTGRAAYLALGVLACGIAAAPFATLGLLQAGATCLFLGWTALRLLGAAHSQAKPPSPAIADDATLPRYTVIAALYDEVEALPDLLAAVSAFDYPAEKIELLVVLEADDDWTRIAAEYLQSRFRFEIVLVQPGGPRTKPKALNCALPFARGEFVVIYDAEDRPEPDQLRCAVAAFRAGDAALACVQARLTIDNTDDGWLAAVFTAEYAALYDVLLPGLAALDLPIPLGGSSNHFSAAILREVGAWDPYNVTEDADLGIRLSRFGYRSGVIHSSTYEEAPARLAPWLRQRTRWFKGWMQTTLVHMRAPRRLARQLGLRSLLALHLVVGGTVLAALVQPLMIGWIVAAWLDGAPLVPSGGGTPAVAMGFVAVVALASGYLTSVVLGLIGLRRRGLLRAAWALLTVPALWLLLSVAAWRAVLQLMRDPQRWEKTAHGRARTSRWAKLRPVQR